MEKEVAQAPLLLVMLVQPPDPADPKERLWGPLPPTFHQSPPPEGYQRLAFTREFVAEKVGAPLPAQVRSAARDCWAKIHAQTRVNKAKYNVWRECFLPSV